MECVVYRCSRQDRMYLYVRAGFPVEQLPAELLRRAGRLTQVMALQLGSRRRLARVDIAAVSARLAAVGYYLQLPPDGHIKAHLHFGD